MYASNEQARLAAASALEHVATAAERVGGAMLTSSPTGVLAVVSPTPGVGAAMTVAMMRAVATDHLHGFLQLLGGEVPRAASMATAVRSAIETWARATWIMDAPSPAQAEYRARASVVEELAVAQRRGIAMLTGEPIADSLARATEERDALSDASPERVPGYTSLAVELLTKGGATDASTIYSHLSGVAHGETIFTSSLVRDPIGNPLSELILPMQNLQSYCNWIVGASSAGMFGILDNWELPPGIGEDFADATIRTINALDEVLS